MPEEKKGSGKSWIAVIGMVTLVLAVIFGLYLGLAYILRKANNKEAGPTTATIGTSGKITDQNLVGTWESDCLVPDPESKWAEKHQIIIKSDGTATQTGWSWFINDCTTLQPENTVISQYKLSIPAAGKINFTYTGYNNPQMSEDLQKTSKISIGATFYDIYKVSGNTLEFGHGFRGDNLPYGSKFGGSDTERIDSLNSYINYKKK